VFHNKYAVIDRLVRYGDVTEFNTKAQQQAAIQANRKRFRAVAGVTYNRLGTLFSNSIIYIDATVAGTMKFSLPGGNRNTYTYTAIESVQRTILHEYAHSQTFGLLEEKANEFALQQLGIIP
jgi:aminopeptidase N